MRNTTLRPGLAAGQPFQITRAKATPFARTMHPRRDEKGHEGDGGKTGDDKDKTPVIKSGDKDKTSEDKDKVEQTPAEKAAEARAAAAEKKAADVQAKLDKKIAEHQTEDEKAIAEKVKAGATEAVAAREVELKNEFGAQIAKLQGQIVDSTINAALTVVGRKPEDFKTVLSTLDKRQFLDDDGAVKTDDVTKWASELAGSTSSKPPRTNTSGGRSGSSDRGFGRYLETK